MMQNPTFVPLLLAERRVDVSVADVQQLPSVQPWKSGPRIEDLPKSALCVPLVAQWLWLAMRYRSLTLPSAANPSILTGGLAGESKAACLAQIGSHYQTHVATWRCVMPGEDALACRRATALAYPLIAKPDIGWCGYGVRRIDDDAELQAYQGSFPPAASFLLQRLVRAPNEAGLFYWRDAQATAGRVVAVAVRHAPRVTGDASHSVRQLIEADNRLRKRAPLYASCLGVAGMQRVPASGEVVMLTTIASLRIGARYEDATSRLTPPLSERIDAIARSMDEFHVGRFDVRFESMEALLAGEFTIIEVNGAGSEAIHYWDSALPLRTAFGGVFAKQRGLFELGAAMRKRGFQPSGISTLARAWIRQMRLTGGYPESN